MSINVNCPVCGRYVSVIGKNKVARHNNYNTVEEGTKYKYLVCKGSGSDVTDLAEEKRMEHARRAVRDAINSAERHLRRAREDADKATAWATKRLDDVTRLRAKLAAMQPDESAESEAPAAELVATLEVQS